MPEFRLLFFNANRLAHWEIFEAEDAISAVHEAAGRPSEGVMELWSESGRIAIFRPLSAHPAPVERRGSGG